MARDDAKARRARATKLRAQIGELTGYLPDGTPAPPAPEEQADGSSESPRDLIETRMRELDAAPKRKRRRRQ